MKKILWLCFGIALNVHGKTVFVHTSYAKKKDMKNEVTSSQASLKQTDNQGRVSADYWSGGGYQAAEGMRYYIDTGKFIAIDIYVGGSDQAKPSKILKFNAHTDKPVMILYNHSKNILNVEIIDKASNQKSREFKLKPKDMASAITMLDPKNALKVTVEKDGKQIGISTSSTVKRLNFEYVNIIVLDVNGVGSLLKPSIKILNWRDANDTLKAFAGKSDKFLVESGQSLKSGHI